MLTLKEPSLEEAGYGIDVDEFNIILYRLKLNKTGNNVGQVRKEAMGKTKGADAERAITQLAKSGNKIIFTTSFGFMNPTLKVAKKFPNVVFEHATGYKRIS